MKFIAGKAANKHSGTAVMSLKEIGEKFGVTLQTIQQQERRALAKIRREIERDAARQGISIEEWLSQFST